MDGKSIMGLLLLAAARGTTITITADGADEQAAVDALVDPRRNRLRRGHMQRLTGIGVSPGIVSGRAVILNQRAQVLRYRVPEARVDHELERLEQGPRACAGPAARHPRQRRAAPRPGARVDLRRADPDARRSDAASRAAADLVREQRVNAEWAVQQVFDEFSAIFDEIADPYLRERKGDVADLVGRLKMNLRQGRDDSARSAARSRRGLGPHRRRADAVAGGAGRLDEGPRLCHRRRQPDLSHRDPGALARSAGRRRPARREPPDSTRPAGRHRRLGQRDHHRSRAMRCWRGWRAAPTMPGRRRRSSTIARRPADHGGRRAHPPRREHRVPRRSRGGALCRRRRHRALPLRIPADRQTRRRRRGGAVRRSTAACSRAWRRAGDGAHLRRRRRSAGAARRRTPGRRRMDRRAGARQPPGAARSAPQPDPARALSDAAARAAARRAPRLAAHHVSVRVGRRAAARGAADGRRSGRRSRAARRSACRPCRSA